MQAPKPKTFFWLASAVTVPLAGWLAGRWLAARELRLAVDELFAGMQDLPVLTYAPAQLAGLPPPVQRYFQRVLQPGQPALRCVRLRHDGFFKTALDKPWSPITGVEYFRADQPGFVWVGTTPWFSARDQYVAGRGSLTVHLLGVLPIVRGRGPAYNQGELLRWLAESIWFPTSLLPALFSSAPLGAQVRWTPLDDHSAHLTLTVHALQVACRVYFDEQDEIVRIETQRYHDDTHLAPWVCHLADYRELHGLRVPMWAEAAWVMNGQEQPYARFTVRELDYDQPRLYPD